MRTARTAFLVSIAACGFQLERASAQVYTSAPGNIPQGAPFNTFVAGQVDFGDVDLDGDWDAAFAAGGDLGNSQSRLWINLGGLQGGSVGSYADETAARLPATSFHSRDLEFADLDGDGDLDLHLINTSELSNQGARWWINAGGIQGGTVGFFTDDTVARWVGLGGSGSSIPPAAVLASGGYIHWAEEHSFADLDGDGDLDLVAASVGGAFSGSEPTRVFLNDGNGFFSEFNPSGFQLSGVSIANGNPGLWCQGVQQSGTSNTSGLFCDIAVQGVAVDVADLEADFDLDILLLDQSETPRMARNLSELGSLALRDATGATWPAGWGRGTFKTEQDFGDLDGDADVDLFGVNWLAPKADQKIARLDDGALASSAAATFAAPLSAPGTGLDGDDADFVDFDADGDLDVFVGTAMADVLLRNDTSSGPIALAVVPSAVQGGPFSLIFDVDAADVDLDGDCDLLRAGQPPSALLLDTLNVSDTSAPKIPALEQPADHGVTSAPTMIRAHVLDNAPDSLTATNITELLWSLDGAPFQAAPMSWSGGQVFRGEIPASALGNVRYFVRSTDWSGNSGQSALKSVHTAGGCSGSVSTYCTGKLNSQGCVPAITFSGAPSASAGSGFLVRVDSLLPSVPALYFYSQSGPATVPFQGGVLCVAAPLVRTPVTMSGGAAACSGSLGLDFNTWIASGADPSLGAGSAVWMQAWSRDPASPSTTSLSDALRFEVCP
jgi:hypothetical protein